jgi:sugar phosphate isomerase/epimerase
MKIAISNIAWEFNEDVEVKSLLKEYSVPGVEIAPTKIWSNPLNANNSEISNYRAFWNGDDIDIVSLQALLFGRPDLVIFQNEKKRQETLEYLARIIELGAGLGAKVFVFGSPKNRLIGDMKYSNAMDVAIEFFNSVGEVANKFGTTFCIEPNPSRYGCDFITNTQEGLELVEEVGHPGFKLHLDAAGMTLSNENIENSLINAKPYLKHFHISEPDLNLITNGQVDHKRFSDILKDINYENYISIEMKTIENKSNIESVRESLEFALDVYK